MDPYVADFLTPSPTNSPGISNISVSASSGIYLNTGTATNMSLIVSPQYNYGVNSASGIFVNSDNPGWSGPFIYTGSMNSGQYQISIFNVGGQYVSLSGGSFSSGQGIQVFAPPNSTFNTGLTFTGPVSNYGVWVNATQEGSNINVASGQTQTLNYAANTGAATPGWNYGPNGITLQTINSGSSSTSFGPNITGFTFAPGINGVTLTSLDLSNSTVKTEIGALIAANTPGISGSATALVINASVAPAAVALTALSALDVPSGSSISFTGFGNTSTSIDVNVTGNSTTTQAIVNGAVTFTNSGLAFGNLTITSNQADQLYR